MYWLSYNQCLGESFWNSPLQYYFVLFPAPFPLIQPQTSPPPPPVAQEIQSLMNISYLSLVATFLFSLSLERLVNVSNAKAIFYDNNRGHVQLSWSANSEYYKCPDAVDTKVLYAYGGIPMDW